MWKYVLKRIVLALVTAVIILSISFILVKLLKYEKPLGTDSQKYSYYKHDVALGYVLDYPSPQENLGEQLWSYTDSDNMPHYFYETPILSQYASWVKNIFTKWDWGLSRKILPNNTAMKIIADGLPVTILLNVLSVIFSVPLGILLGIFAALKKNKPADHVISTGIMIFISIPSFVLITLLIMLLCYKTGWLPTQFPNPTDPLSMRIKGYILPVICLSFGSICGYARFTRAELCEVMESDYLMLARTKGLTKRQAIIRHALRNAMVPIVPSILAEFIGLLSGSMIMEKLYGIPGIGDVFVRSLGEKDYNVLFSDMALYTVIGLLAGIILDLSYGFIDPRIRMGAKK